MTEGTQRKLAAVMCADVSGYSRMMGQDEDGTLAALKAHRNAIDPYVFNAGGHIVKTTGDGMLAEYTSVLAAVESSLAAQREMAQRNATLPTDRRMQFRIGIHVGEIIADDGDIFGDTVNIAARLQEAAEPGGISLSGAARDAVQQKIDAHLIDLGEANLKNIATPIRHWRVDMGASQSAALSAAAAQAPSERCAVAVLPFDNMSTDPEQDYFADGITEDIITALSRIVGLRVIARNSTFAFKGQAKDIRLIATELDARYVLEGSVRRSGNRLRINAQLIDAVNGQHIWAERYDRNLDDIFEVQDDITANIVGRAAPEVWRSEGERVRHHNVGQLDAWDLLLRARGAYNLASKDGFEQAEVLCRRAFQQDSNYAPAYTLLADTQFQLLIFGYRRGSSAEWSKVLANCETASRIDPDEVLIYSGVLAHMGEYEKALTFAKRGINLNPSFAPAHHAFGVALYRDGQYAAAVGEFEKTLRHSPNNPQNYQTATLLGYTHYSLSNNEAALSWADEALRMAPTFTQAQGVRAAALAQLDQINEAKASINQFLAMFPNATASGITRNYRLRKQEDVERYREGLIKAGLPE